MGDNKTLYHFPCKDVEKGIRYGIGKLAPRTFILWQIHESWPSLKSFGHYICKCGSHVKICFSSAIFFLNSSYIVSLEGILHLNVYALIIFIVGTVNIIRPSYIRT